MKSNFGIIENVEYWINVFIFLCIYAISFHNPLSISALSPPSDVTVTNVTYTEISVEWTPVTVTGEMIQYKASISEEADSLAVLVGETSHTFTGLTQGINYTINVGNSLTDSDDYDSEYATVIGMTGKILY